MISGNLGPAPTRGYRGPGTIPAEGINLVETADAVIGGANRR